MSAGPTILPEKRAESDGEGLSTTQWGAILVLVTVLAHRATLVGGFIWDDDDYVTEMQPADSAERLGESGSCRRARRSTTRWSYTSFWLEHQLWELSADGGYHVVNVLLHAAGRDPAVALAAALDVARRLAGRRAVRAASGARRIGGLDHRAEERALSLLFYLAAAYSPS